MQGELVYLLREDKDLFMALCFLFIFFFKSNESDKIEEMRRSTFLIKRGSGDI